MKKEINIAKILKDAPIGTELWSPVCGKCYLLNVKDKGIYPIVVITDYCADKPGYPAFKENGNFENYNGGECLLFPSKENRDWSTFEVPEKPKHFEPFERIIVRLSKEMEWRASLYSHKSDSWYIDIQGNCYTATNILPYKGNEDKVGKKTN